MELVNIKVQITGTAYDPVTKKELEITLPDFDFGATLEELLCHSSIMYTHIKCLKNFAKTGRWTDK